MDELIDLIDELDAGVDEANEEWLDYMEELFLAFGDTLFDEIYGMFDTGGFVPDLPEAPVHDGLFVQASTVDEITQMVIEGFTRGETYENFMRPKLRRSGTFARRRAVKDFLASFGKQLPDGFRLDGWSVVGKDDRAETALIEMMGSFNRSLPQMVAEVKQEWAEQYGSLRGLNRTNMAARMRGKIEAWQDRWRPVTARTESAKQYDEMLRELVSRNEVNPMVEIVPDTADANCRWGCEDYAGEQGLFDEFPDFPLHPNCVHYRKLIAGSFVPPYVLNLGGPTMYMLVDLP